MPLVYPLFGMSSLVKRGTVVPAAPAPRTREGRAWVGASGLEEFLAFDIGEERMGLPLASVREILKSGTPTVVPRTPPHVIGILSVRGRITTIVDLRARLGAPPAAPTRSSRILLVDGGGEKAEAEVIGVRVDAVHNVIRLREDEIEPADVVAGDLPDHVLGLGRPKRSQRDAGDRGVKGTDERDATAEVVILLDPRMLLRISGRPR